MKRYEALREAAQAVVDGLSTDEYAIERLEDDARKLAEMVLRDTPATTDRGAVDLIRELRGWADTYEDHMGGDDFEKRAEVFARADAFLRGQ